MRIPSWASRTWTALSAGIVRSGTSGERGEAALAAHCEEHGAAEWVAEVGRLRHVVARLEVDAAQAGYGIRPHRYVDDASRRVSEAALAACAVPMDLPRELVEEPLAGRARDR